MSETYIVTAKTIDEAIAIANREYADAEHEVSYDIIDMPKKGFLGIGARDAKIKITVSKIEKVELGSLVEEIRSMKTITDRGNGGRQHTSNGNGSVNGQKQEHAKQGQQKPSQPKPQGQPKPSQPKAEQQKPNQPKPNQPKAEQPKQQPQQGQQKPKPSQPKAEAKLQAKKPEAKAEVKVEQKVEPKVESKVEPKVQHKPETKPEAKPEAKLQAKTEVKVEPKAEAELQAKVEAKPETKVENTAPETQKNDTRKSHLGNEVKQKSRRTEIKPSKAENIPSSQVTVSEPMGLSDFSGENKTGFGSGSYTSGRMSNDIRKKPKQNANVQNNVQDPAKANRDALRALTINVDEHLAQENAEAQDNVQAADETEKAVREKGFSQKNSSRRRDNGRRREEAAAVASVTAEAVAAVTEVTDAENDTETVEKPAEEKRLREGVTQAEMDYALDFANTLLKNMKLDAKAEQADANGDEYIINGDANVYPKINITGDDTGILIGHHGETLDAIQYLVNLSALRKSKQGDGDYVKIVVDIEGYREKREETLRALARRMAAKAVKYKRNVFLEPMNAYERRIIHSELQSYDKVSTHSVGTDKDRKIIITYEGADKREYVKKKPVNADTGVNAASGDVSSDSTPKERRRPKKPVRLPIDKLTDLLESRETVVSEETTVSAETSEDVSAVTETEVTAETEVTSSEE